MRNFVYLKFTIIHNRTNRNDYTKNKEDNAHYRKYTKKASSKISRGDRSTESTRVDIIIFRIIFHSSKGTKKTEKANIRLIYFSNAHAQAEGFARART